MSSLPELGSVELVDEYPGMIRITTVDGARWHYLPDSDGVLQLGRPYIAMGPGCRVHLFVPLAPGAMPRVLLVDQFA